MSRSQFFLVFLRDGLARVVQDGPTDASYRDLVADGWELVNDMTTTEYDGYSYAAKVHRAGPAEWVDKMTPRPMSEAIPLYRSVSPGELRDIDSRGKIRGNGSQFNGHDARRFAFMGSVVDIGLIHQGEEIERQAFYHVHEEEGFRTRFDQLLASRRAMGEEAAELIRATVAQHNKGRRKDKVVYDERRLGSVREPGYDIRPSSLPNCPLPRRLEDLVKAIGECEEAIVSTQNDFRQLIKDTMARMELEREEAPFTSAVLCFAPMRHGVHYSPSHGRTGMNGKDEFGFFPDSVGVNDVEEVIWIRHGVEIGRSSFDQVFHRLEEFDEHVAAHSRTIAAALDEVPMAPPLPSPTMR
jgi:hypothetical protein